ncbi:MAG: hypothetical protein H6505_02460 [Calditrichaeota bacterium]|nr:hypothetical protein [Calditrichota bacterium]
MKKILLLLLAMCSAAFAQTAVVTQAEWFVGTDPGAGSGNAISIGTPDPSEALAFSVATGSFAAGDLVRVKLRCKTDSLRSGVTNFWGPVTDAVISMAPGGGSVRLITSMSYQVDGGSFTNVDVTDSPNAVLNDLVATTGLTAGLHRLRMRATDDLGRMGLINDGFFVVNNTAGAAVRLVTSMEYRIDGGAFTIYDNADAPLVNFADVIATNALAIGLHLVDMRSIDDLGRVGQVHRAYLIVSSPFVGGVERTIVAAEVFTGTDPGPGNGVDIPLPADGAYDEGAEDIDYVYTGFPVGNYRVGFRTQDDLGRWSQVVYDSLLVGPILVVSSAGNDVILNWTFPDGIDQYYIYRSANTAGPFTLIDSTAARTYTDPGIIPIQDKGFYHVTFRDDSIHIRQPGGTPVGR